MVRFITALALLLGSLTAATAQTVRGVVTEMDSRVPLAGVFVVMVDSAGRARASSLTNQHGFFAIRAPAPGSFSLRAERIGHRTASTPRFTLEADQIQTQNIAVAVAAIELEPIAVESTNRCTDNPASSASTAQLWEEVRKALSVTQWVARRATLEFERRSYVRTLALRTLNVMSESASVAITRSLPYRSAPAEVLMRHGFIREVDGDVFYYGPDADVLLSDAFLEQHCFSTVMGTAENQGLIGLSFEPMRGRRLPDVKGTLWLDARTFELRYLDYRYTNLRREYDTPQTGGRTRFRRLPTGEWIVDGWYIRMPSLRRTATQLVPHEYKEEGGEVLRIRDARADAVLVEASGMITGTVYDSVSGAPLANALVYLSGTSFRAHSDMAGAFTIARVPSGRYMIAFTHDRLDELPVLPAARVLTVNADSTAVVSMAVPASRTLFEMACADQASQTGVGVLSGYVYDATDANEAGVQLTVSFKEQGEIRELQARTDQIGHYMVCGVPVDVLLTVTAATENGRDVRQVSLDDAFFRRVDLSLKNVQ